MRKLRMKWAHTPGFVLLLGGMLALPAFAADTGHPIRIRVGTNELNRIDPRLFGQFLERPSWGETGPEAAVDANGNLPGEVVAILKEMRIPLVRFPGGTDIDYTDWTDMISNIPGRQGEGRPVTVGHKGDRVTNRFGYDEYFRLAGQLNWDTLLVVNFFDGLLKRKPLAEAARHAAGLVAYANAPVGAKLPDGMPDWPALRQKNGRTAPYGVKIFQIGNEWAMKTQEARKAADAKDDKALAAWYVTCIVAYADLMHAVDPSIELIIDAQLYNGEVEKLVLQDPEVRRRVRYVAMHRYAPWGIQRAERAGKVIPPAELVPAETWLALVSTPGCYEQGVCTAFGSQYRFLHDLGYRIAATEWNWNGSGKFLKELGFPDGLGYPHAAALGAAGFLQGMMRQGDQIALATQSMLLGNAWQIAALRLPGKPGAPPLHTNGQGAAASLYNQFHGERRLELSSENLPMLPQPLKLGAASPIPEVALVDVVATRSDKVIYLHVINRSPNREVTVEIDAGALGVGDRDAIRHTLIPSPASRLSETRAWMVRQDVPARFAKGIGLVGFPRGSVSVIEIGL